MADVKYAKNINSQFWPSFDLWLTSNDLERSRVGSTPKTCDILWGSLKPLGTNTIHYLKVAVEKCLCKRIFKKVPPTPTRLGLDLKIPPGGWGTLTLPTPHGHTHQRPKCKHPNLNSSIHGVNKNICLRKSPGEGSKTISGPWTNMCGLVNFSYTAEGTELLNQC